MRTDRFLLLLTAVFGGLLALCTEEPLNARQTWDALEAKVGGTTSPDGKTEIQCDLPESLHKKNVGGSDGAGLCVFTSIMHSARYQRVEVLEDFQKWMQQYPGGGYPEKVKAKISQICKEKGVPEPAYLQVQSKDLEILKLACKTGRMPGITYSYSATGRYGGQKIGHMTNLVAASDGNYAILDNNFPGAQSYEWLNESEFIRTYTAGGSGWAVILLDPGPPPFPHN